MTAGYRDFEFDLPGALLARLVKILDSLAAAPPGWQAVQLPSHIILYKTGSTYPSGKIIARS